MNDIAAGNEDRCCKTEKYEYAAKAKNPDNGDEADCGYYVKCPNTEVFARFEKSAKSQQGMAIYGDEAFLYYHGGSCDVMDLCSRRIVGHFLPESYTGEAKAPMTNHANQAVFAAAPLTGEKYPPVYITAGNSGDKAADGYFGRCIVEQIDHDENGYSSKIVQTIVFNDDPEAYKTSRFESPCWGWPSFIPDTENKRLYIVSARYRTKLREYDSRNAYIITSFRLPGLTSSKTAHKVVLTSHDIIDQFTTHYDIGATQAGTLYDGKIYYTFGFGRPDFPDGLRVFDLNKKTMICGYDFSNTCFADEEIEDCGFYKGALLCNTNKGGIYKIT